MAPSLDRSKLAATPGAFAHQRTTPSAGEVRVSCTGGCDRTTVRPAGAAAESKLEAYRIEHARGLHA